MLKNLHLIYILAFFVAPIKGESPPTEGGESSLEEEVRELRSEVKALRDELKPKPKGWHHYLWKPIKWILWFEVFNCAAILIYFIHGHVLDNKIRKNIQYLKKELNKTPCLDKYYVGREIWRLESILGGMEVLWGRMLSSPAYALTLGWVHLGDVLSPSVPLLATNPKKIGVDWGLKC
jgi:hypothetical protein